MSIRKAMAIVMVIMTLVACGPEQGTRGSRNPGEWSGTRLRVCENPRTVPQGSRWGPIPGKIHYLIIISADTLNENGSCRPNSSLPFTIRLDGWVNQQPGVKMELGKPLPWVANLRTPHFEHILIPATTKIKHVTIEVRAAPQQTAIDFRKLTPTKLRCTIFLNGDRVNYAWRSVSREPISPRCIVRDSL